MSYPDILTALSGNKITSIQMWEKHRRDEIYTLFQNYVYGIPPIDKPEDISFSVKTVHREGNILQKKVVIKFLGYEMKADVFLPKNYEKKLPAYLYLMHEAEILNCPLDNELDFEMLPIPGITSRGYAVVCMNNNSVSPDKPSGKPFAEGVFEAVKGHRRNNSWQIIAAWAWGASRVLDYLETDEDIDSKRVIVIGHSRGGKTALWAAASDKRFAMAVSNSSGSAGACFTRGNRLEHVIDVADVEHSWFCENYKKYIDDEDMLPVDQHMLLALSAPRPLYVASADKDQWADPDYELISCRLANAAYELYGLKGAVVPDDGVKLDTPYHDGLIGHHRKAGEHCIVKEDWRMFMDFSDKYLK